MSKCLDGEYQMWVKKEKSCLYRILSDQIITLAWKDDFTEF